MNMKHPYNKRMQKDLAYGQAADTGRYVKSNYDVRVF